MDTFEIIEDHDARMSEARSARESEAELSAFLDAFGIDDSAESNLIDGNDRARHARLCFELKYRSGC